MEVLLLVVHVVAAAAIIGLVLVQHGKGADVGAAFGSGSAGSVFGSAGSANFLSRMTAVLAAVFFLTSMGLTYFSIKKPAAGKGVMSSQPATDGKDQTSLPGKVPPAGALPAGKADASAGKAEVPAAKSDKPASAAADQAESKAKEVPK